MTESAYKLLMIEDDPAVATSLQAGLELHGFGVVGKRTGEEGVRYICENDAHLVLLDVRLPDGSGFDFCRRMRQLGVRQPILMLTVQNDEMDKVLGLEMGADDYVTKPFSLRELVSRIRAQLRRAYGELSSAQGERLYVRDLVIDQARGLVRREERLIPLTPTEFRLLVYLARHPGQAFSRAQIMDAVWGYGADAGGEKGVNVHIRRLREKIEPDPDRPAIILTVPGIGYRLVG